MTLACRLSASSTEYLTIYMKRKTMYGSRRVLTGGSTVDTISHFVFFLGKASMVCTLTLKLVLAPALDVVKVGFGPAPIIRRDPPASPYVVCVCVCVCVCVRLCVSVHM